MIAYSDEDELEEKIEFLNKAGIQAIVKATGVDKQERLVKLKVLRDNLRELIDQDEKFASDVKNFIDQHLPRVFPPGSSAVENPWSYLNRDQFSDDEQEDVQDKADAAKDEDDIILLSDSDDDMDTPAPAKAVQIAPIPVVRLPAKTKPNPFDTVMVSSSGRSALLATLRQRVLVHAKENYCQTRKIRSQELAKRIEVSENCRQFLVLLKEKWDDQAQRANEERRTRYFERVSDSKLN